MKITLRYIFSVFCIIAVLTGTAFSNVEAQEHILAERGSLGFWFYVDKEYHNGMNPKGRQVTLLEVPDILRIQLQAAPTVVTLNWQCGG